MSSATPSGTATAAMQDSLSTVPHWEQTRRPVSASQLMPRKVGCDKAGILVLRLWSTEFKIELGYKLVSSPSMQEMLEPGSRSVLKVEKKLGELLPMKDRCQQLVW